MISYNSVDSLTVVEHLMFFLVKNGKPRLNSVQRKMR
jgi:hypothetical protein